MCVEPVCLPCRPDPHGVPFPVSSRSGGGTVGKSASSGEPLRASPQPDGAPSDDGFWPPCASRRSLDAGGMSGFAADVTSTCVQNATVPFLIPHGANRQRSGGRARRPPDRRSSASRPAGAALPGSAPMRHTADAGAPSTHTAGQTVCIRRRSYGDRQRSTRVPTSRSLTPCRSNASEKAAHTRRQPHPQWLTVRTSSGAPWCSVPRGRPRRRWATPLLGSHCVPVATIAPSTFSTSGVTPSRPETTDSVDVARRSARSR